MLYIKKSERFQTNNLNKQLQELGKEQTKPKVDRRKDIIKIRTEITEIEDR